MLNLNIDLSNVDTTMPVLSSGLYNLTIKNFEVAENKKKTGQNLVATFATTTQETSVQAMEKGEMGDLKPGFTIRKWYPLQQSDNPDAPDFTRDLAILQEAALGVKKNLDLNELLDKLVAAKVKVSDSEEYGLGNDIGRISAPIT